MKDETQMFDETLSLLIVKARMRVWAGDCYLRARLTLSVPLVTKAREVETVTTRHMGAS